MEKQQVYCRYCGKLIDEDALFCTYCGKKTRGCKKRHLWYKGKVKTICGIFGICNIGDIWLIMFTF